MSIEVEENKDAISNLPAVEKRFQFKEKRFSNSTSGSYNVNVKGKFILKSFENNF